MSLFFLRFASIVSISMICIGTQTTNQRRAAISLCKALVDVKTGSHHEAVVSGVFMSGVEDFTLVDSKCLQTETKAWIEFQLKSEKNHKYLNRLTAKTGTAYVEFEGELYGPPEPDPALPESIRNGIKQGWGHLGTYRYQLIVRSIIKVSPAEPTRK
jgi:hypothetical protein